MPGGATERNRLRQKRRTHSVAEYRKMRRLFPNRLNIVSDGDSWFAYPSKWMPIGGKTNLIDYISSATRGKANFLDMASNGDEAVDILSGKQKHKIIDQLRWHEKHFGKKPVDLLLISGGGNDIVGENDFERFIKSPYLPSYTTPKDCIQRVRLARKVEQVRLSYLELLDIRDQYSPNTLVVTHCYDYPYPSLKGAEFWGGIYKTASWMKPYMDAAGIPAEMQRAVTTVFMDSLAQCFLQIASERTGFIAVDTRKTLDTEKQWVNEIHPTSSGFKLIASEMLVTIREKFPVLE